MAKRPNQSEDYLGAVRRLLSGVLVLFLLALFLLWRIDSPRVERFRIAVMDRVVPSFDWAMAPVTGAVNMMRNYQSYHRIHEQNQELRRELQRMKAWKEAALQLEQENARLLELNKVRLDPRLTFITGVVLADSGSPFRQSVLVNVGERDGIIDGWAAMDGIGLVGRVSGVGKRTARVVLLTDTSSRIPAIIQPSGQRAVITGDNTIAPPISFLEDADQVRPGDRVVSSGDGGVLPPDLLIGQVTKDPGGRLRVRLSADYERLEFVRIMRDQTRELIVDQGRVIINGNVASTAPETAPDLSEGEDG